VWEELYTGQPVNAKQVFRAAQVSKNEATVRRWCRAWEQEGLLDPTIRGASQPHVEQFA
jgi:transposase